MANAERMEAQLKALSLISEQGEEGTTRLSYTPEYRKGADYIKKLMEEAGLTVREDAAGSVWGLLPGTDPDAPKLISGSHLDTVRCSGFYDGQAGIICALEAARMIKESGKPLKGDFEVVAIPMEEGARFPNLTGSKLAAGVLKEADLDLVKDTEGTTLREAMLSYLGLTGKLDGVDRSKEKVKAFIELHMEQGTLLEDEGIDLGVVDGIFGCYWKTITVRGEVSHPSTPMAKRKDAGLAACRIVSTCQSMWPRIMWAKRQSPAARWISTPARSTPSPLGRCSRWTSAAATRRTSMSWTPIWRKRSPRWRRTTGSRWNRRSSPTPRQPPTRLPS